MQQRRRSFGSRWPGLDQLTGVPVEPIVTAAFAVLLLMGHLGHGSPWLAVVLDIGFCTAASLSRWRPRLAAALCLALLVISWFLPASWGVSAQLLAVVPLFSLRSQEHTRTALPYAAALLAAAIATVPVDPYVRDHPATFLAFWLVLIIAAWALGSAFAHLRRHHRESTRQAVAAQKTALARDLHDTVAHKLTQLSLKAQHAQLTGRLDEADLTYFASTASECVDDLRSIVRLLRGDDRPETSWQLPTPADVLEREIQRLTSHGFRPTFAVESDLAAIPRDYWATIDGVLAEAVNNVLRHGDRTQPVQILADLDDTSATLAILNTPRDEPPPAGDTFGIVGMAERAQAVGGSVTSSRTGAVWTTLLSLPLTPNHGPTEGTERASADR